MSNYSNVTEEDLNILRKLTAQQKIQRALKIKNRISKQTHDIKLAENISPTTKKFSEIIESTQKLGEIVKESNTPRLAIENTHNALPIENEEEHPGVKYETSLEIHWILWKIIMVFYYRRKWKWWFFLEWTSSWKKWC